MRLEKKWHCLQLTSVLGMKYWMYGSEQKALSEVKLNKNRPIYDFA